MTGPDLGEGAGDGAPPPPAGTAAAITAAAADEPTGDAPVAFDRFYRDHYPAMVRLARVLVDSPHTAEDLVQDSFVRLHHHWGAVRQPDSYLRRCVVNACRSHYRRLGRERRHAAPGPPARDVRGADTALDRAGLPEGSSSAEAQADDAGLLAGAIAALPYRQRAAVVLRYYADLPDAEIAAALGCRVGTVASLVHRALERLRLVVHDDD